MKVPFPKLPLEVPSLTAARIAKLSKTARSPAEVLELATLQRSERASWMRTGPAPASVSVLKKDPQLITIAQDIADTRAMASEYVTAAAEGRKRLVALEAELAAAKSIPSLQERAKTVASVRSELQRVTDRVAEAQQGIDDWTDPKQLQRLREKVGAHLSSRDSAFARLPPTARDAKIEQVTEELIGHADSLPRAALTTGFPLVPSTFTRVPKSISERLRKLGAAPGRVAELQRAIFEHALRQDPHFRDLATRWERTAADFASQPKSQLLEQSNDIMRSLLNQRFRAIEEQFAKLYPAAGRTGFPGPAITELLSASRR